MPSMGQMKKITVRLTPNAKANKVIGWDDNVLKVQVTAIPEKGKANKALIALLSKHWKIPKSAISITRGETARIKTLEIDADIEQ